MASRDFRLLCAGAAVGIGAAAMQTLLVGLCGPAESLTLTLAAGLVYCWPDIQLDQRSMRGYAAAARAELVRRKWLAPEPRQVLREIAEACKPEGDQ